MRISRRKFVISLAATGGAVAGGTLLINTFDQYGIDQKITLKLNQFLENPERAKIIGEEYLSQHPEEKDPNKLLHAIFPDRDIFWIFKNVENLKTTFREQVKKDFEFDRTTLVKGWTLSKSEARFCALVSLSETQISPHFKDTSSSVVEEHSELLENLAK